MTTPDIHFIDQFKSGMLHLVQQQGSRLRPHVRNIPVDSESVYVNRLAAVDEQTDLDKSVGRHGDTVNIELTHSRRRLQTAPVRVSTLLDSEDKMRMLGDPSNDYSKALAMALGRDIDRTIIDAFDGTAYAGRSGATSTAFDTTNNQIAVDYVPSGTATTSNLTIDKLIEARSILAKGEVDLDAEQPIFVMSRSQIDSLLRTTQVTSTDFAQLKALESGEVDSFMGFRFVITQLLDLNSSTSVRDCYAFVPSAMALGIGKEPMADIGPRRDKNLSQQIFFSMDIGATRMEEEKIVKVLCDEDF